MYVIIGGRGFLGSYLIKKIIASYHSDILPKDKINNILWQQLNIEDEESIEKFAKLVSENRIPGETVKCIYVIGYIRPDNCIKNPEIAININIGGLVDFLKYFHSLLDSFIFTSTDFVAGESFRDHKFTEREKANPVNYFGAIKYICEKIVIANGYNVVRLPFMFGKSLIPEKTHFIEHVEKSIEVEQNFYVLSDYYETSLDYNTVAKCIYSLCKIYGAHIPEPIINIVGDDKVSKYEIALKYAHKKGLDSTYIKPLQLKDADFFVAKRCTILLDNSLLKKLLDVKKITIEF